MFDRIPLPLSWPVYVSQADAPRTPSGADGGCRPRRSFSAPRTEPPTAQSASIPGAARALRLRTASSTSRAGIPSRPARIRRAGAPGASMISSAMAGSGRARCSRRFPVPAARLLSGVFRRLLRRRALRHERRVPGDGARVAQADVPQLVPPTVSVRLRDVPMRRDHDPIHRSSRRLPTMCGITCSSRRGSCRRSISTMRSARRSSMRSASCRGTRITRAENRLLARHRTEIFAQLAGLTRIVELGPGDGRKLQTLVAGTSEPLTAHLVDVSAGALARAAHTLSDALHVTRRHPPGVVRGWARRGHARSPAARQGRGPDDRTLVLFLGSNIGNFDSVARQPRCSTASAALARARRRVPASARISSSRSAISCLPTTIRSV